MSAAALGHSQIANLGSPCGRKIVLADVAGFCFGVRRAISMTERAQEAGLGSITTLGPIVHNSQVIERLRARGIGGAQNLAEIEKGTVVLSAHGSAPIVIREAHERGLDILDVTCPFVTKVHRAAKNLLNQGYDVILVGDPGHTEVKGVFGAVEEIGGTIRLVSSPEEVASMPLGNKVGVVCQTTQRSETFARVVAEVCLRATDVRAINTVCSATEELQTAAIKLAKSVDVVLVIGGARSANTRRLREICERTGTPAYQVETAKDIDMAWLEGHNVVGLTAGASTPDWLIEEVAMAVNGGELPEGWNLHHPDE